MTQLGLVCVCTLCGHSCFVELCATTNPSSANHNSPKILPLALALTHLRKSVLLSCARWVCVVYLDRECQFCTFLWVSWAITMPFHWGGCSFCDFIAIWLHKRVFCFLLTKCCLFCVYALKQTAAGFILRSFTDSYCMEKVWKHQQNGTELIRVMELTYIGCVSATMDSGVRSVARVCLALGNRPLNDCQNPLTYHLKIVLLQLFWQLVSTLLTFDSYANPNTGLRVSVLDLFQATLNSPLLLRDCHVIVCFGCVCVRAWVWCVCCLYCVCNSLRFSYFCGSLVGQHRVTSHGSTWEQRTVSWALVSVFLAPHAAGAVSPIWVWLLKHVISCKCVHECAFAQRTDEWPHTCAGVWYCADLWSPFSEITSFFHITNSGSSSKRAYALLMRSVQTKQMYVYHRCRWDLISVCAEDISWTGEWRNSQSISLCDTWSSHSIW